MRTTGSLDGDDPPPMVPPEIAAEAAMWVTRLHGDDRNREMELACLEWQRRSAVHRYAFERTTEVWLMVPNAARAAGYVPSPKRPPVAISSAARSRRKLLSVAVVSVALTAAVAAWLAARYEGTEFNTAVGDSQTVTLADGTRMFLNTDTHVHVDLGSKQRTVSLKGGEAAFEVAKDAERPFVVRASGSEVVALGTAFSVRLTAADANTAESVAVTLLEGKVSVRSVVGGAADAAVAPAQAVVMQPGERLRLAKTPGRKGVAKQLLDRPSVEQVVAWKRNEVVFDRTSLPEAVAEMNRYSKNTVVLMGDLAQSQLQVSGQYRTGDNSGFAKALATVYGLVVRDHDGRLELSRGS